MIASGTLAELHRWPVKSMGGEPVDALRVDHRGAGGDRTYAVLFEHKGQWRRLTAREAPRLLAWRASYDVPGDALDPATPPRALLTGPDGTTWTWGDPQLPAALSADLGREVRLHADPAGQQDLADTVLLTMAATHAELEAEMGQPVDPRRFRTNLHLGLDADAWAETGWEGRTATVGDVALELLHPCLRCAIPTRHPDNQAKWAELLRHLTRAHDRLYGINAMVTRAGTLRTGDPVAVT